MSVLKIVRCFAKQVVFLIKGSTRISYKMQGKQLHVFSQKNKSSYQIKLTFEGKHIFEIYLNHILSAFYTSSTLVSWEFSFGAESCHPEIHKKVQLWPSSSINMEAGSVPNNSKGYALF